MLTNKGFVLVDYKTSSLVPDWDNYLDQLYRYIYLVKSRYPDVPILKIGIVNIRKAQLYKRKDTSTQEYFNILCNEYFRNPEKYLDYHEFPAESINETFMNEYIKNLSRMVDTAYVIDKNASWYINFAEAEGRYGKSDYYDIFYRTKNAYKKYKIKDKVWSEETKSFVKFRDCIPLDMEVIDNHNIVNHYSDYAKLEKEHPDNFDAWLKENYTIDDELVKLYKTTTIKLAENINENCEDKKDVK